MTQLNTSSVILFFVLFFIAYVSVNTFGMQKECPTIINETCSLLPEIQGIIVTTILDLYVDELDKIIKQFYKKTHKEAHSIFFLYGRDSNNLLDKIIYWIKRTRFKPLQEHINLNSTSNKKNTLLHHTTYATLEYYSPVDMFNVMRYLLEHKASPNIQNNDKKTAFFVCIQTINDFYNKKDITTRQSNVINLFLNAHANPNIAAQHNGFLPLLATLKYAKPIAQILEFTDVKAFINIEHEEWENSTPVSVVISLSNIEFLRILVNAGADFTIKNCHGLTALDYVLKYKKNKDIINLLENAMKTSK